MSINHNVDLNLSASIMPPVLNMAQYDANSRTIVATLWDGTSGFNIPSGASVMVRFGKPDGTGGLYDATEAEAAITYSGNVVTAPVATQMLSVAGKVQADIEIYQTGETAQAAVKLATFCFVVNVEKAAYQDADIISSDYYNVLAAQIAAAIEAGTKADAAIQAAQTATEAATTATNAKTAAENAKTSAESAKTAAVNAKTAAESAKTAAQTAKTAAESAKTAAAGSATAAAGSASSAEEDAQRAAQDAEDAEAWAVGKRNGVDVPANDPAYQNNAKYYKELAQSASGGGILSVNGKTPNESGAVTLGAGDINTSDGESLQVALNNKAKKSVGKSATLTVAGWSSNAQTVNVEGMTANANVIVTAAPDSYIAYAEAGVHCTAQGTNTLTFACEETPTEALTANVLILG